MALSPGDKLGPYEIVAPIGAGGMGEVYRAKDTKLDREVAIKVLPSALAQDPERLARFEREAKVLASLNHPNIAQIYGIEESSTGRALVMELVPGETLKGPFPLETTLKYAKQIAEALEAAHDKSIVHRDLKPANIMVTPAGTVKVLDFGLAAVTQPSASSSGDPSDSPTLTMRATQAGMILGTAGYMAPEQAAGQPVDRRADIWAFGVVLYEMLTGQRLFSGDSIAHILADVLRAPIDFDKLPKETPRAIRELVKRCLDRVVKTRLRDIGEARIAIQNTGKDEEIVPAALSPSRFGRLPWIAAGVLAVAAVALGLASYRHVSEELPRVTKTFVPPPEEASFTPQSLPAVSPDGRWIAFVAASEGKDLLWVRGLDSLTARALPGTEGVLMPFWSPDSRALGFFADRKLKKIEIAGGPAVALCDAGAGVATGSWSRDGVIVFGTGVGGIVRVPAAGGSTTPVTTVDRVSGETVHALPWFLPDSNHFVYTAFNTDPEKNAVYAAALDSKDRKQIVVRTTNAVYTESGYLLFARERTLMAQPFDTGKLQATGDAIPIAEQVNANGAAFRRSQFSVSRNGVLVYISGGLGRVSQLTWYDRTGRLLGVVGKPEDIQTPRLSPDGRVVATDRRDPSVGSRDIWLLDVARGTEQRLTFAYDNSFPLWSPDGKRLAYARMASRKIVTKAADGTGLEEELESSFNYPQDWTRDGRYLISAMLPGNSKTGLDLWALPLTPGKTGIAGKPLPLRSAEFDELHARVSPDGRWLAYQSNESKRDEIYVVGFPGLNGRWQVSVSGGTHPVWSRDGREMYFVGPDNKLMAVPVKSGEQFQAGAPQPLFDVRFSTYPYATYDVSADGRFLIATPLDQSAAPMTVVLNWHAMLKK